MTTIPTFSDEALTAAITATIDFIQRVTDAGDITTAEADFVRTAATARIAIVHRPDSVAAKNLPGVEVALDTIAGRMRTLVRNATDAGVLAGRRVDTPEQVRREGVAAAEACVRCGGTGIYHDFGGCFRCGGSGRDPRHDG